MDVTVLIHVFVCLYFKTGIMKTFSLCTKSSDVYQTVSGGIRVGQQLSNTF